MESGEGEESNGGEDNETGLSVEDLQRGFVAEVKSGEDGEEKGRKKYKEDGEDERNISRQFVGADQDLRGLTDG